MPESGSDFFRIDADDTLPFNKNGILTREAALRHYGLETAVGVRPYITNFGGSRPGYNPRYAKESEEYSWLTSRANLGVACGGAPSKRGEASDKGIMTSLAFHHNSILAIVPRLFADGVGRSDGLSPRAMNIVVDDFYVRKVLMDLFGHRFAVHAGGYGTLEEWLEAVLFAVGHGKAVDILNVNGFWSDTLAQLKKLQEAGLLGAKYMKSIREFPDAQSAFAAARDYFEKDFIFKPPDHLEQKRKPSQSLHTFLRANPGFVSDHIFQFLSDENKLAPRVGIVVSGNIGPERTHLRDPGLNEEFCRAAQDIGRKIARQKAVLVLSGKNDGLRKIMAGAALAEGGSVIRVQKGAIDKPCTVERHGRELIFTVTREFEKAMLFDMISHATGFLPGGIHTLDRVFEIVTREQTGHGRLNFLEPSPAFSKINIPVLGYNIGGLWSDIERQVKRFAADGFIGEKDAELFQMLPDIESLSRALVANANRVVEGRHDLLLEMEKKVSSTRPAGQKPPEPR